MKKDDKLITIIKNDSKIEPELMYEYLTLANRFSEDFKSNILLTSIELDEKYGLGVDTWQGFLKHPPIKKYIGSFVNEIVGKKANEALASGKGTRDAVGVIKELERYSDMHSNDKFIVFRLPDKIKDEVYDFTGKLTEE